jgi:SAM-dependent methyltransferase
MIEVGEPDFFPVDDLNKTHPESCRGCALQGPCPGLYNGYHEVYGATEVRPRRDRPRSNSFNYKLEQLVSLAFEGRSHEQCPLTNGLGVTPWDRGRDLYVRNGKRIARFRAESRDFSDREIIEIKHELGQLYLDASNKPAPDDFARDLVQLVRSPLCEGCPSRAACTGMFEPLFEDVFTRDDARVRELLATLSGDVLDLGCGEGPYVEMLAPMAVAGTINYLGVDPDPAAIARLKARWPASNLLCSDAEQLELDPEQRFDHVLILRAWNHLREPDRVLERLLARLRAGGSLIVVDNVAFGLARTREQSERAERSRAGLEHYRNDASVDALRTLAPFIERFGLVELEHRAVTPSTSNQWLLRLGVGAA